MFNFLRYAMPHERGRAKVWHAEEVIRCSPPRQKSTTPNVIGQLQFIIFPPAAVYCIPISRLVQKWRDCPN